ncbi:MAG: single-stranded-DNA-specific exonuclease RecJ, partial [Desulfobacca sp.]|nr:single-stranded-DNA-specific exonuclease RecJ [Desulfobacca sp.]
MKWNVLPYDPLQADPLVKALNLPPLVAQMLINRGLHQPEQTLDFFSPTLLQLPLPNLMKDMDKAVNRVLKAIQGQERLAIFGDYDADGITATALMVHFLKPFFPDILFYIPHRVREGYGLSIPGITLLKEQGVSLMITVDCGISNHQEIEFAQSLGLETIVTDHHQISRKGVPSAGAVLNPKQEGCPFPFKDLAGVGVAFYLIIALRQALDLQGFFPKGKPNLRAYLDLVALGTVADVVPLLGVNRILVREGLDVMTRSPQVGLVALKEVSGIQPEGAVSSVDVAFRLAPRINALGRIQEAGGGVRLLITEDVQEARGLAQLMNQENSRRQAMEQIMIKEIDEELQSRSEIKEKKSLVLGSETWHRGILGLVASRLAERWARPVFLFTLEGETAHGSGRSIEGFNLFKGLETLEDYLLGFGGHAAAAGATLKVKDLPGFEQAFESLVHNAVKETDLTPVLTIEGEIDFAGLSKEIAPFLARLAPFGSKNPEPLLATRQARVKSIRLVGNGHLRLRVEQGGIIMEGIGFGLGERLLNLGDSIDLAY